MKKITVLFLALAMALGMVACSHDVVENTEGPDTATGQDVSLDAFTVGFGRADITPAYSVPLAGYGNTSQRMSQGFYDLQYTTCTAFTDEDGETILLFHNDSIRTSDGIVNICRPAVSEATGVPEDHIMISATHNHSSPDSTSSEASIKQWLADLAVAMTDAAVEAMADRKPAQMYIASTTVEGVGFTRHYIMDDGSYCGDNFVGTGTVEVGHANEADRTLQLIKFVREGGKDVVLANFQSHPHTGGSAKDYNMTSDIVGAFRDVMEEETGCLFTYFTGASGNINAKSRIAGENAASDYIGQGKILARTAIDAASTYTRVQTGKVQILSTSYEADVDHTYDDKIEEAKIIQALWNKTNNLNRCVEEGAQYGIKSPYHANAIVTKFGMPQTYTINEINAFAIGDVAFITAPYEMFHQSGSYIRENSPYSMTFIVTCANGHNSYIPTQDTYDFYSYECCLCRFTPGTAEILADKYVELLNTLHK